MKVWMATIALAVLGLAALPTGSAQAQAPDAGAACLDGLAAAPPCGYIVPQITLDFPDKPPCRSKALGGPVDLSACLPLPSVDAAVQQDGIMRFSWAVSEDGAYPLDPACGPSTATGGSDGCIVVSFTGTATNYKWIDVAIEPAQVVVDLATLSDPANLKVNEQNQVWFWYEVPVKVTFTRTAVGDDDASLQRIERAQGATAVFVKAKSSASGQYYKEAFGVEEFRFNPCANDDALRSSISKCAGVPTSEGATPAVDGEGQDAPAPVFAFAAIGLLALAAMRRRN